MWLCVLVCSEGVLRDGLVAGDPRVDGVRRRESLHHVAVEPLLDQGHVGLLEAGTGRYQEIDETVVD